MSGCAVASDGSLLSPSKIVFYNDADDITPISGPSLMAPTAPSASASMNTSSATTLDNYFVTRQPVVELGGLRRTTRLPKPSARVRDAVDALGDSATLGKRKANNTQVHRRVVRKTTPDSDDSDREDSGSDDGSIASLKTVDDTEKATDYDGDTDEVQAAYDQTKEMGDEDRKVSPLF